MIYDFFGYCKSLGIWNNGGRAGYGRLSDTTVIDDGLITDSGQCRCYDDDVDTYPNTRTGDSITFLAFQKDGGHMSGNSNNRTYWPITGMTPQSDFSVFSLNWPRRLIAEMDTTLFKVGRDTSSRGGMVAVWVRPDGSVYISDDYDKTSIVDGLNGAGVIRVGWPVLTVVSFSGGNVNVWINGVLEISGPFYGSSQDTSGSMEQGLEVRNKSNLYSNYLSGNHDRTDTVLTFTENLKPGWPDSGYAAIGSQFIKYTGKTANTLTGVTWDELGFYGYNRAKSSASCRPLVATTLCGWVGGMGWANSAVSEAEAIEMARQAGFLGAPEGAGALVNPMNWSNCRLPKTTPIAADSSEIVQKLLSCTDDNTPFVGSKPWVNTNIFTFAVYKTEPDTIIQPITPKAGQTMDGNGRLNLRFCMEVARIPPDAQPGKGLSGGYADGEMVVYDPQRDMIFDGYHAEWKTPQVPPAAGVLEVKLGGVTGSASSSQGYYGYDGSQERAGANNAGGWGGAATGIGYHTGLTTGFEFDKGIPQKALAMSMPIIAPGGLGDGYVFPASSRDGTAVGDEAQYGVKEGVMFRLPHDYDWRQHTNEVTRFACRALVEFGGVVRDRAGNVVGFYLEDGEIFEQRHGFDPYTGRMPIVNGTKLPDMPWDLLEVVDPDWLESFGYKNEQASGELPVNLEIEDQKKNVYIGETPMTVFGQDSQRRSIFINNTSASVIYYGKTPDQCLDKKAFINPGESIKRIGYYGELMIYCPDRVEIEVGEFVT